MGRIHRFAPAGLLLAGIVFSGCQFQIRDDWQVMRSQDDPQVGMDYAARLQAKKKQQQKTRHDDDDAASDSNTGSASTR